MAKGATGDYRVVHAGSIFAYPCDALGATIAAVVFSRAVGLFWLGVIIEHCDNYTMNLPL